MRTFLPLLAAIFCAALTPLPASAKEPTVSVDANGVAVQGYDTVAFFTESKPVKGDAKYTASYQGAKYLFASDKHLALFQKEPAKYVPQYGGFCAVGVSKKARFAGQASNWSIVKGKLYLCKSDEAHAKFKAATAETLESADRNWTDMRLGS